MGSHVHMSHLALLAACFLIAVLAIPSSFTIKAAAHHGAQAAGDGVAPIYSKKDPLKPSFPTSTVGRAAERQADHPDDHRVISTPITLTATTREADASLPQQQELGGSQRKADQGRVINAGQGRPRKIRGGELGALPAAAREAASLLNWPPKDSSVVGQPSPTRKGDGNNIDGHVVAAQSKGFRHQGLFPQGPSRKGESPRKSINYGGHEDGRGTTFGPSKGFPDQGLFQQGPGRKGERSDGPRKSGGHLDGGFSKRGLFQQGPGRKGEGNDSPRKSGGHVDGLDKIFGQSKGLVGKKGEGNDGPRKSGGHEDGQVTIFNQSKAFTSRKGDGNDSPRKSGGHQDGLDTRFIQSKGFASRKGDGNDNPRKSGGHQDNPDKVFNQPKGFTQQGLFQQGPSRRGEWREGPRNSGGGQQLRPHLVDGPKGFVGEGLFQQDLGSRKGEGNEDPRKSSGGREQAKPNDRANDLGKVVQGPNKNGKQGHGPNVPFKDGPY